MAEGSISSFLLLFSDFFYVRLHLDPQTAKEYTSTKKKPPILFYK
jgi:hypothetical protein